MRQLHFDLLRLLEDDRQGRSPAGRSVSSTAGRAARAVPGASPSTRTPPTLRCTGFWLRCSVSPRDWSSCFTNC